MTEDIEKQIISKLSNNESVSIKGFLDEVPYEIIFMGHNKEKGINISSILAVPQIDNRSNQIVLESNNMESEKLSDIIENGCRTGIKIAKLTSERPAPIIIPLIPCYNNGPYFQQLSKECFELSNQDSNFRIDEQVINIIGYAKEILYKKYNMLIQNKIFINGYSASAVFAQRFALLHPEIIDTVCLGGASGSIPIPIKEIGYPIGISDYKNLFGKDFDFENYISIKFRYYVGELELTAKTKSRFDDYGNPAPMHDMSFFDRSVPINIGIKQREIFGQDMFERATKTVELLKKMDFDIEHKIFAGRTHNNAVGLGVNELGDNFFKNVYIENMKEETPQIIL